MANNLSPISISQEQIRAVFASCDIKESSIEKYVRAIRPFTKFVSNKSLNQNILLDFKRELEKNKSISVSTKNVSLSAAIVFLRQLAVSGKIPDYTQNIKLFKQSKGHKKEGLTVEELRIFVKYLADLDPSKETIRLKALFTLKYYQGLRDIEIYRLDVDDLLLDQETAHIQRKGADDKEVIYLHPNTIKALKYYLNYCGIKSGAVFISFSRNDSNGNRLSLRSIHESLDSALDEAGIDKNPHGFRHYYVTRLLNILNGDVRKTMKFSGHKSVNTVMIYDDRRNFKEDLPKVFEGFNQI